MQVFTAVRECAKEVAELHASPASHPTWRSACVRIIHALQKGFPMLQPLVRVEVVPQLAADTESVAFTLPTAPSHVHAPLAGSVTEVTWSVTEDTRTQGEADAVEESSAGEIEAKMQHLEHKLLELKNEHGNVDHPEIAATLYDLGELSHQAVDLNQAKQLLEAVPANGALLVWG